MALQTTTISFSSLATTGSGVITSGGIVCKGVEVPITFTGPTTGITVQLFNSANTAITSSAVALSTITKSSLTKLTSNNGTELGLSNSTLANYITAVQDVTTGNPVANNKLMYVAALTQTATGATGSTFSGDPVIFVVNPTDGDKLTISWDDAVNTVSAIGKDVSGTKYATGFAYVVCCTPNVDGCFKYKTALGGITTCA